MPSNVIIFDADYVSELTAKMNAACELMAEAVSSLKSAQSHEKWKCKERTRILEDFDELNSRLDRLDSGVNETTRILANSVSRFSALESRYDSQAGTLSDELTASHGFSASVHSTPDSAGSASAGAIGVRVPGGFRPGGHHADSEGRTMGGGNTMTINLPVTHIPDNPDAAAEGIKDTQKIADAVTDSVAAMMTHALGGQNWRSDTGSTGIHAAAGNLAEAYNAGRSIFENSAAIISNPTQPHTAERLAMAAGIVTLAGTAAGAGLTVLGQAAARTREGSGSGDFAQNAGHISAALQDNSDAAEFREMLGMFASSGSSSTGSSGSSGGSFFDMILAELKKAFTGSQDSRNTSSIFSASSTTGAGSSQSGTSPIMEFLGNFVMDQAV